MTKQYFMDIGGDEIMVSVNGAGNVFMAVNDSSEGDTVTALSELENEEAISLGLELIRLGAITKGQKKGGNK